MLRASVLAFWLALPVLLDCSTTSGGEAQAAPPKVAGPASPSAPSAPSTAPIATKAKVLLTPSGQATVSVRVEVVQKPEDRQRGLMFRKHLDDDAGMLFLFERPEPQTFWMHNTLIPLDMIFIAADKSVLGVVENATPRTDSPRGVPGVSQYVLEVNAGFCRKYGIEAGTFVRFVDVVDAVDAVDARSR